MFYSTLDLSTIHIRVFECRSSSGPAWAGDIIPRSRRTRPSPVKNGGRQLPAAPQGDIHLGMTARRKKPRLRRLLRLYWRFVRDFLHALFDPKLEHYAASLSFSTLFSLVPLLAILASVFTALPAFAQLRAAVERLLRSSLPLTDPAMIMDAIDRFVANTDRLGLLGVGWMMLAAYFFSRTLDYIVQDVTNAPTRSVAAALATYAALAMSVPVLATVAYGVQGKLMGWVGHLPGSGLLRWGISLLLAWSIFWLFYQFAPNRRIEPGAAAVSSFIVALIWTLLRDVFLWYTAHATTYMTIYGVVASVMLFLWWIYISWAVLIYGLRFCILLHGRQEAAA